MTLPPKKNVGPLLPFDPGKLPDPDFVIPDYTEPMVGWRGWGVHEDLPPFGVPPKLFSLSWGYYWTPRKRAEADCNRPYPCNKPVTKKGHNGTVVTTLIGIPGEPCSCGFYSAKTFERLVHMGYNRYSDNGTVVVIGKVANTGKVIECETGWRAQYSYPIKLYVPLEASRLAGPLEEAYGIPVVLRDVLEILDGEPRRPRTYKQILAQKGRR